MLYAQWFMVVITIECAVAVRHAHYRPYTLRPRVVNGREDDLKLYTFVVSLESETSLVPNFPLFRVCSGSVITNQWVLTAAHCLVTTVAVARYGDLTVPRNETKEHSKVLKQIPHPLFVMGSSSIQNDIGLVLIEEIPLDKLGRIHTGDYKTFVGRACVIAGFGFTHANPKEISVKEMIEDFKKPLQIGEGSVRGGNDWYQVSSPRMTVVPKCGENKQWPNHGDSGGPLIIDKKIVGVCTGGTPREEKRFIYNFYTPVSPYIDWIKGNIVTQTQ